MQISAAAPLKSVAYQSTTTRTLRSEPDIADQFTGIVLGGAVGASAGMLAGLQGGWGGAVVGGMTLSAAAVAATMAHDVHVSKRNLRLIAAGAVVAGAAIALLVPGPAAGLALGMSGEFGGAFLGFAGMCAWRGRSNG